MSFLQNLKIWFIINCFLNKLFQVVSKKKKQFFLFRETIHSNISKKFSNIFFIKKTFIKEKNVLTNRPKIKRNMTCTQLFWLHIHSLHISYLFFPLHSLNGLWVFLSIYSKCPFYAESLEEIVFICYCFEIANGTDIDGDYRV